MVDRDLIRKPLNLKMTTKDIIVEMSEGNPGAIQVLILLLKGEGRGGSLDILLLDEMNIRGSQIWIGYKNFAKQDMEKFVDAIRRRDKEMIDTINKESGPDGEIAVRFKPEPFILDDLEL